MEMKMNNKSPYQPRLLPGMKRKPRGYEPKGIKPEDFKKSDLAYRIGKKQRAYYDNN
jgi:hypothetical protein